MTVSLLPYETQLSQPLSGYGVARGYALAREYGTLLEDSPGVLNVTWFSDDARFHLDDYINKQNVLFLASENPRLTVANPLQPERVLLWCALLNAGMFGPVFINGAVTCHPPAE
jgi:hypothetical protein